MRISSIEGNRQWLDGGAMFGNAPRLRTQYGVFEDEHVLLRSLEARGISHEDIDAWERARNPHPRDRASFIPELTSLLESSGRLELVEGEYSPTLGSAVRFEFSHGHTPGLMLAEIGGDGGIVFCADLIPARPWVHLPITMGYDRYPEQLVDEKRAFLEDKLGRGADPARRNRQRREYCRQFPTRGAVAYPAFRISSRTTRRRVASSSSLAR